MAVIGDSAAVELFLASKGLPSKPLGKTRISSVLAAGGGAAQAASTLAEQSGRWVKLTEKSAAAMKQSTASMMKG